ncbi:MAG: UDP-N-acetylmuramoyl-L-alanine--D-glutamate ligase [Gemmatimonadota bacterium]|nr:MAG: UDP-N-acetylmuramoyl-L-alanine--D-glutamate ligase [Gemmatimonadota bacterium]
MSLGNVRKKKCVVLGLASSGVAVASLLARKGAEVVGSDVLTKEQLPETAEKLERQGVHIEWGGHPDTLLEGAEYVVISPGVPQNVPVVQRAHERGIPVVGEIEVASWFCRAPIIAVTGSNGKTTTTALLGELFTGDGWVVTVAGNIGSPFSDSADSIPPEGIAVVEVSSFQLETIVAFRPEVSVLLNLSPDHLDRYAGYEAYVAAKARIFENQDERDVAVLNADDSGVMGLAGQISAKIVPFSIARDLEEGVFVSGGVLTARLSGQEEQMCSVEEIRVPGPHNLSNVAAALAVSKTKGLGTSKLRKVLRTFAGVEHRLEWVADVGGIAFINDSKATNVVSVQCALQSFQTPIILIAGGREKGTDFGPLRRSVAEKVKLLILMGEAAPKLRHALSGVVETVEAGSMEEAVDKAFQSAREGDTVLLSPACASFDMYHNYEERGARFKDAVRRIRDREHHG